MINLHKYFCGLPIILINLIQLHISQGKLNNFLKGAAFNRYSNASNLKGILP